MVFKSILEGVSMLVGGGELIPGVVVGGLIEGEIGGLFIGVIGWFEGGVVVVVLLSGLFLTHFVWLVSLNKLKFKKLSQEYLVLEYLVLQMVVYHA